MAENEVFFREYNERVQKGIDEVRKLAAERNQKSFIPQKDVSLHFYCECSDENCRKRIVLKSSQYSSIHKRRDRFIVAWGHEAGFIEHVVDRKSGYCVVEKNIEPPESADGLKPTAVNNT